MACISARHVSDILVGLAIVSLTGSSGALLFFARSTRGIDSSLQRLLRRSAFVSGVVVILVGLLILSFEPDTTGIAVSIPLIVGTSLDLWTIVRIRPRATPGS